MRLRYAFAALTGVMFVGLVTWTYTSIVAPGNKGDQVPLIQADATPMRVAPDDPGGMQIPNQDSTVFGLVDKTAAGEAPAQFEGAPAAGEATAESGFHSMERGFVLEKDGEANVESLFAKQEPIEVPNPTALQNPPTDADVAVENLKAEPEATAQASTTPDIQVGPEEVSTPAVEQSATSPATDGKAAMLSSLEQAAQTAVETPEAQIASEAKPDTGIVIEKAAAQTDVLKAPAPAAKPAAPTSFGVKTETAARKPVASVEYADDMDAPYSPAMERAGSMPLPSPSPTPSSVVPSNSNAAMPVMEIEPVPASPAGRMAPIVDGDMNAMYDGVQQQQAAIPLPPREIDIAPATAQKTEIPFHEIAPAAGDGTHYIQLASLPNEGAAQNEWQTMLRQYPDVLSRSSVRFQSVDLEGRGTYTRVQAGPFSEPEARRACADLQVAGKTGGCIVIRK